MVTPDLVRLEAVIEQLPFSDQLWLMERLAKRIRQRAESAPITLERELEGMADDPAIQLELREIEAEFAVTEFDGLEPLP
jgi:hypothetical protein